MGNMSTSTTYQETGNSKLCENCGTEIKEKQLVSPLKIIKVYPMCKCEAEAIRLKEEQEQQQAKRERLERLFQQSRLGERFREALFRNYKKTPGNTAIFKRMVDYTANFKNKPDSILIHSHPGTGKTYVVSCVANQLLSQGCSVIFVVVPDLLADIRSTYNRDSKNTEEQLLNGLTQCDLLILDDIGAERRMGEDDWAGEKLFSIINRRYLDKKPILFTSNLDGNELNKKLGRRVFSRICEMTNGEFINLNHIKDMRIFGMNTTN